MKKKILKRNITISIDAEINKIITELFNNKSEYVEWLIIKDLTDNKIIGLNKIIL